MCAIDGFLLWVTKRRSSWACIGNPNPEQDRKPCDMYSRNCQMLREGMCLFTTTCGGQSLARTATAFGCNTQHPQETRCLCFPLLFDLPLFPLPLRLFKAPKILHLQQPVTQSCQTFRCTTATQPQLRHRELLAHPLLLVTGVMNIISHRFASAVLAP